MCLPLCFLYHALQTVGSDESSWNPVYIIAFFKLFSGDSAVSSSDQVFHVLQFYPVIQQVIFSACYMPETVTNIGANGENMSKGKFYVYYILVI